VTGRLHFWTAPLKNGRLRSLPTANGSRTSAGSPKPDISTVDAFKRALLNARSIAFLKVGSGIHLEVVVARLGISEAIVKNYPAGC
jgi:molybdate transport system substrate-binding protein